MEAANLYKLAGASRKHVLSVKSTGDGARMTWHTVICLLAYSFVSLTLFMSLAWFIWLRTRNAGWVDTAWSLGCGITGVAGGLWFADFSSRALLVAALALAWSVRLGLHLGRRARSRADDPRYAALIRDWGEEAPRRMFWFLQYQAWAGIPPALTIMLTALDPKPLWRWQDVLAVSVMIVCLVGEAIADHQLQRFRRDAGDPARVCDTGLWRFSRHPNYFFEFLSWCAYPLLAVSWDAPSTWLTLAGPATMYWLLVHVSGIPPLEEHMLRTRGDAFRDYQRRTSAFFPWF